MLRSSKTRHFLCFSHNIYVILLQQYFLYNSSTFLHSSSNVYVNDELFFCWGKFHPQLLKRNLLSYIKYYIHFSNSFTKKNCLICIFVGYGEWVLEQKDTNYSYSILVKDMSSEYQMIDAILLHLYPHSFSVKRMTNTLFSVPKNWQW